MFFRHRTTNPNLLIKGGLVALLLASVATYLIRRTHGVSESVADPVSGFLYGVAIMTMLVGIRAQARAKGNGAPRT